MYFLVRPLRHQEVQVRASHKPEGPDMPCMHFGRQRGELRPAQEEARSKCQRSYVAASVCAMSRTDSMTLAVAFRGRGAGPGIVFVEASLDSGPDRSHFSPRTSREEDSVEG